MRYILKAIDQKGQYEMYRIVRYKGGPEVWVSSVSFDYEGNDKIIFSGSGLPLDEAGNPTEFTLIMEEALNLVASQLDAHFSFPLEITFRIGASSVGSEYKV